MIAGGTFKEYFSLYFLKKTNTFRHTSNWISIKYAQKLDLDCQCGHSKT